MSELLNRTNISELLKISAEKPENAETLRALTEKFKKRVEGLRKEIKPAGSKVKAGALKGF